MKHLKFHNFLTKGLQLERRVKQFLDTKIEDISVLELQKLNIIEYGYKEEHFGITDFIQNIIWFTFLFVYNIVTGNKSVADKNSGFKVKIDVKVDFESKRLQIFYFLEDDIFGVVVGKQFQNIRNFIQTCFPIIAKSDFEMEFRFFPISRS